MAATVKKLILVGLFYGLISANLVVFFHLYWAPGWFESHLRWTYMVWKSLGLGLALEYGWHGAWPLREHFAAVFLAGLVIVPLLAAPLFGRGRHSLSLAAMGILAWLALGANLSGLLGPQVEVDGLIAAVAALS